ncbi:MAG: RidA family protein [Armatimonadetes bacterium]|nr:RidA family protein [Armatimonadota bacterium]
MTRIVVSTPNAPAAIGPYSQAIKASGSFLFCSGQIALTPGGELIETSVDDQAEQALKNLGAVLAEAGLDYENVVKTTIFLSSMEHFATVNEIYRKFFKNDPPARSTVAVAGLPRGVDVEIEAIAVF